MHKLSNKTGASELLQAPAIIVYFCGCQTMTSSLTNFVLKQLMEGRSPSQIQYYYCQGSTIPIQLL